MRKFLVLLSVLSSTALVAPAAFAKTPAKVGISKAVRASATQSPRVRIGKRTRKHVSAKVVTQTAKIAKK
jgi:hypothetical protein